MNSGDGSVNRLTALVMMIKDQLETNHELIKKYYGHKEESEIKIENTFNRLFR